MNTSNNKIFLKLYYSKHRKVLSRILYLLLAINSVAAIGIDFESGAEIGSRGIAVLSSFRGWGMGAAVFVLCLAALYQYTFTKFPRIQRDVVFFSFFLSVLMLLGLCYRNATGIALCMLNTVQLGKSMIVLIGYGSLFYCFLLLLFRWMKGLAAKQHQKADEDGRKASSFRTGVFLFICWLPYLIAFYPGTALYDAGTMLEQYFGYAPLTNHHPYFQILFLATFVNLGNALGSAAFGMFLYVLIQVAAFIMVLTYILNLFRRLGVSAGVLRALLYLYAFLPIFPVYAISVGKNINFAIVILLLTVFMFEMSLSPEQFVHSRPKMILLPILLILVCLFRNEGLAIAIGCFPCFILIAKKHWKLLCGIFASVFLFTIVWFQSILPMAGVAPGSIAESMSIPFLQTARCVTYYGEEMSMEERTAIDRLLEFDTLPERYLPEFSDRVKELYHNEATKADWEAYLKVYWKQFLDHPVTYLDAVLNKCYGYFYPDDPGRTKAYYVVGADIFRLNENGYDLKSKFPELVEAMDQFMTVFRNIPLLGYTTSIGAWFWCTFILMFFLIRCRKNKLLVLYIPAGLIFLVCVASPVNAYFRYGLSVVFTVPFFFLVTLHAINDGE